MNFAIKTLLGENQGVFYFLINPVIIAFLYLNQQK